MSLHDPDARPIAKGRLGKPVEFGYKGQVLDNEDGVLLDHTVEQGNPPDAPQLAPAVDRAIQRTGRRPRTVAADRGYGEKKVEDALHDMGVADVVIPRKGKPCKEPGPPNTDPRSGEPSSGEPAVKAGSAGSNVDTAGTVPAWTALKEPGSGPDRRSWRTTWSKSGRSPADPRPAPKIKQDPDTAPGTAHASARTSSGRSN